MCRPVVYLHVGGPKTGTTYLQEVLWHNRNALRRDGLSYPGRDAGSHFHAVQDLLRISFNRHDDPCVAGAWDRLISELRSERGTVLISHELFALATAEHVERAMRALSFAEVHVVYTVRDLARQIPSVWQEDLKNRHTLSFTEFVRGLRGDAPNQHKLVELFWRFQDPVGVLRRWGAGIPPEQVHVVTVPAAGSAPGLLWERFAATIGVDPDRYETDVGHASNRSLGVIEANLLRRMNPVLAEELDWPAYQRWVRRFVTESAVAAGDRLIPITLPASEHDWVLERSQRFVAELRDAGYHVVGDLAEALAAIPATDGASRHPDDASDAEQLAVAADAMLGLIRRFEEFLPARPAVPDDPATLLRIGVQQLSNRHRSVMGLRRVYRWAKIGVGRVRCVARGSTSARHLFTRSG